MTDLSSFYSFLFFSNGLYLFPTLQYLYKIGVVYSANGCLRRLHLQRSRLLRHPMRSVRPLQMNVKMNCSVFSKTCWTCDGSRQFRRAFSDRSIHSGKYCAIQKLTGCLVHFKEFRVDGLHIFLHLLCIAKECGPHHIITPEFGFRQVAFVNQ